MSFGYQILGFGSGGGAGPFPVATGGTITTVSTDYKLHTFTADGQFIFTAGTDPTYGSKVEFLLVAGGGGGAGGGSGAGGGGGYYYNTGVEFTVTTGTYAIDVGAGGSAGQYDPPQDEAGAGEATTFSTLSAAGGGIGGNTGDTGGQGGSGGGGGHHANAGGQGNVPSVSPSQ